jgi:hypothetical protein
MNRKLKHRIKNLESSCHITLHTTIQMQGILRGGTERDEQYINDEKTKTKLFYCNKLWLQVK